MNAHQRRMARRRREGDGRRDLAWLQARMSWLGGLTYEQMVEGYRYWMQPENQIRDHVSPDNALLQMPRSRQ